MELSKVENFVNYSHHYRCSASREDKHNIRFEDKDGYLVSLIKANLPKEVDENTHQHKSLPPKKDEDILSLELSYPFSGWYELYLAQDYISCVISVSDDQLWEGHHYSTRHYFFNEAIGKQMFDFARERLNDTGN